MMRKNYVTIDIERERMKAAFSLLDIDGDGFLSRQELMDELVTKASGITIEDVEDILRDADMDGNEHIDCLDRKPSPSMSNKENAAFIRSRSISIVT
jgi:Ca2+-binding EF-hand superfamily protein